MVKLLAIVFDPIKLAPELHTHTHTRVINVTMSVGLLFLPWGPCVLLSDRPVTLRQNALVFWLVPDLLWQAALHSC